MSTASIYNNIKVSESLVCGGQPTADQLRAAAAEGFTTVINLAMRSSDNALEDEAALVRSLGMAYYHIPVNWEHPTEPDFAAFDQRMQTLPPGKTLLHCAANYRVTAFYSLYGLKNLGWSVEQARAFRSQIWESSDYPVWDAFIANLTAQITAR